MECTVRLAFAVAAHLDPEILVIDEVLAVGDAEFQRKCLGKMQEVAKGGRTVLFVSHNFEAVEALCDRAIVLNSGGIIQNGSAKDCIETALQALRTGELGCRFRLQLLRSDSSIPLPKSVRVHALGKPVGSVIDFNDDIVATLELTAPVSGPHTFSFVVLTTGGLHIINSFYHDCSASKPLDIGITKNVRVTIPKQFLTAGVYEAAFAYMSKNADVFWLTRDTMFEVSEVNSYRNAGLTVRRTGLVSLMLPWDRS